MIEVRPCELVEFLAGRLRGQGMLETDVEAIAKIVVMARYGVASRDEARALFDRWEIRVTGE